MPDFPPNTHLLPTYVVVLALDLISRFRMYKMIDELNFRVMGFNPLCWLIYTACHVRLSMRIECVLLPWTP